MLQFPIMIFTNSYPFGIMSNPPTPPNDVKQPVTNAMKNINGKFSNVICLGWNTCVKPIPNTEYSAIFGVLRSVNIVLAI
jgi:hypothetical protein